MNNELRMLISLDRMREHLDRMEKHLDEISYSLKGLVRVLSKIEQKSTTNNTEEEQENEGEH